MNVLLTVQERPQVLHLANVIVCRAASESNTLGNLVPKTLEDSRVLAEQIHAKRQSCGRLWAWGGCISAHV